ncbi:PREDICTED: LOC110752877 [Prunus dulcis]|uniref:PREDICTED: LOC110752877 n=1 Tax=Prunus dulcis TaxID=3755 RepID=A0A5E4FPT4_PRUDU|nr:PREDICTED: LOC110752877 [Prunus dulcis]
MSFSFYVSHLLCPIILVLEPTIGSGKATVHELSPTTISMDVRHDHLETQLQDTQDTITTLLSTQEAHQTYISSLHKSVDNLATAQTNLQSSIKNQFGQLQQTFFDELRHVRPHPHLSSLTFLQHPPPSLHL